MATCEICCPHYPGMPEAVDCDYTPGGLISILLARYCDIASVIRYEGTYQGASQSALYTEPFGDLLEGWVPNVDQALYQVGAVGDIIMKPSTAAEIAAGAPPRRVFGKVAHVRGTAGASPDLQGGDGSGAKYWLQTLTFQWPRMDAFAIRKIKELGKTEVVIILESKNLNRALGVEAAFLQPSPTPPISEYRRFVFGLDGGLFLTTAPAALGGARDDLQGWTLTFENEARSPMEEFIPFTTADFNVSGGTAGPGKYIAPPFDAPPFSPTRPMCNAMGKLTAGLEIEGEERGGCGCSPDEEPDGDGD